MALLVHLPLTGDLHNQGLANIEVTNNGATVDNNGKIGKCYSFDGTSKYISLTNPFTDASEISCSIWVKPLTNTSTNEQIMNIGTSSGWSNIRFGILQQSNNQFVFHVSDGTNTISYNCHSEIINVNEWIYIVCTYKNRELKMYLNGELVKTYSISFDPSFSSISKIGIGAAPNGAEKFTGFINDVKIFSHCLSQKEISELKKMLILHYPLDGNNGTLANENLILNGAEARQSSASASESAYTDYYYCSDYATELMSNNTTDEFTLSYDYEVYGAEPSSRAVEVYAQCNNSIIQAPDTVISSSNEKGHASFTFKLTSTQAQSTFSPFRTRMRLRFAIDGAYLIIKKVKLEKGNKATPWCPNPSDALYTALGYDDGIEYDTSGYKNNATGANNLSYSLDSPRYLASAVCNYSNGLTIPKIFSDTCNNQHMSFAFWLKRTADFEVYEEDIYNGIANIYIRKDYNNNPYRLFISWNHATDDLVNGNTWHTGYTVPLDTWVHIVITFDSGVLKAYINGTLFGTSDRSSSGIYIQGNHGTSLGNITGQLSDFRIYASCLSDTEIQKLYTVSASIDSNGNAYSAAYVEG